MAFPSVFPGDIDSYVSKADGIDDVMAVDVNELQSALVAIETKLGVGSDPAVVGTGIAGVLRLAYWTMDTHTIAASRLAANIGCVIPLDYTATVKASITANREWTFPNVTGSVAFGADTLSATSANAYTTALHTHAITCAPALVGNGTAEGQVIIAGASPFAPGWSVGTFVFGAGGRTYTFPDTAGTVALLEVANVFTALQSVTAPYDVNNGIIKLRSTGADNVGMSWWCRAAGAVAGSRNWQISANYYAYGDLVFMQSISNSGNPTVSQMSLTAAGLAVVAGFGCNSKSAQTAYSLGAASTDLATVVALSNKLRLMAIANGTGSA